MSALQMKFRKNRMEGLEGGYRRERRMVAAETEKRKASTKRFNQRNSLKVKDRSGNDIKKMKMGGATP